MLRTQPRTEEQKAIVAQLVERFSIDGSKILFLNPDRRTEPWLPAKQRAQIARQSGKFKVIRVEHERVLEIGSTRQVVSQGTVVDLDDRIYSMPGVATIGERIPEIDEDVDAWDLADARALGSTLDLAGFNPVDPTSVVPLNGNSEQQVPRDVDAAKTLARLSDNARIHILAKEKGLIVGKDFTGYRQFIAHFLNQPYTGKETTVGFEPTQRKSFIALLEHYIPQPTATEVVPPEFTEVADDIPEGAAAS
jgi:hypothetical protein